MKPTFHCPLTASLLFFLGIIYCVTRKDTEEVTRELNIRGLAAGCYHGDMDARQRSDVHRQWMTNNAGTKVGAVNSYSFLYCFFIQKNTIKSG